MGRVLDGANGVRVHLPDYKLIFTEIIEPSGQRERCRGGSGERDREREKEICIKVGQVKLAGRWVRLVGEVPYCRSCKAAK